MNRRDFVNKAGMAAIAVGLAGCSTNANKTGESVDDLALGPCVQDHPGDAEIKRRAKLLMLFMITISQRDKSCHRLADVFFPTQGNPTVDFGLTRDLGFDDDNDVTNFITKVNKAGTDRGMNADAIHGHFIAIQQLFQDVTGYTGSECPNHPSLQKIIATAKASIDEPDPAPAKSGTTH